MISTHSVAGRILVGVLIGLIVGMVYMLMLPALGFEVFSMFGLGTLLMFFFMGAMTALMGQFDRHPLFDFKMSWWARGAAIGGAFMLMYVLLSYESLEIVLQSEVVSWMGLTSPFWAILDGIVIGLIMSWAETKIAGEGPKLQLR